MVAPFNRMNVDISCIGNHELDHGIEVAFDLMKQTNCEWILSNLTQIHNGKPILNVAPYKIIETPELKIGFLGFAEKDWMEILSPEIDHSALKYQDYNEVL